jgi:dTDP-4-amino-4,6-dideoxygalactose transaminase
VRNAFEIVEDFEEALCEYTRANHAVAVDSCTNALFLSFVMAKELLGYDAPMQLPRHTYIGVAQSALNAGFDIEWTDEQWSGAYVIRPMQIVDSAKYFERGMMTKIPFGGKLTCVSFHIAKRLPLGHGGAILTEDGVFADWLRRARFDGRTAGQTGENAKEITRPGYHMYMTPDDAARGLWLLQQQVDQPLNASWEHYPDLEQLLG